MNSGIAAHFAYVSLSVQDRSNGSEMGVYWTANWTAPAVFGGSLAPSRVRVGRRFV
jgi:hypothetical protein